MKNTLIKKGGITTAILGFGLVLSACGGGGGGGGGGSPSSVVPSAYQGTYTGALQPGDFVSFYVSGSTLSYTVTGTIASQTLCGKDHINLPPYAVCNLSGSITGTLTLTKAPGLSGNNYFEATIETTTRPSTVYVFLSGSAGIFVVPMQKATLAFIGYKNKLSATSISAYISSSSFTNSSHTFIYARYNYTPGSSGSVNIYSLTVSPSNSFSYSNLDGSDSGSGCWVIDPNNPNRIIAIDGNTIMTSIYPGTTSFTCSTFVQSWTHNHNLSSWKQDYNIMLTPKHGIIVDYTGANSMGLGIGVGVQTPLNLHTRSYTIQSLNSSLATESITVSITSTSPGKIGSYSDLYIDNGSTKHYSGSLIYDTDCSNKQITGIISAHNTNDGECYDVFFDSTNHYYVAVQVPQTPLNYPTISIGAVQK